MEYIFLPLFRFKIGRKIWSAFFELNAFYLRSVTKEENQGILPSFFGKKLPNALAGLSFESIKKTGKI